MMQAYQGYFLEDGHFMVDNMPIRLPIKRRIIINVLEDEMEDVVTNLGIERRKNIEAVMKAINNAAEAEDELSEDDWNELTNIRAKTNAGMARQVDI